MVKDEPKIELGKSILEVLDKSDLEITAFFWFYLAPNNSWRLIISAKKYERKETKERYEDFIKRFGEEEAIDQIGLSNITIVSSSDGLLNVLKHAIKTKSMDISGIRFTSNMTNGVLIEDAYIYRLC